MEALLEKFGQPGEEPVALWVRLVDGLRPSRADRTDEAAQRLLALTQVLAHRPHLRDSLRASLLRLFAERSQVSLYVSSGLLPSTGFFSETALRISGRLLPQVVDTHYMKDVLSTLFPQSDDEIWVNALPAALWVDFLGTLMGEPTPLAEAEAGPLPPAVDQVLEALRVLSYHVSAIGLDPELVRIDPTLEEHESPFLAQNAELLAYIAQYKAWWCTPGTLADDEAHLSVMLRQCEEVLQRVRRRATKLGTSLSLTFKLERLHQHLIRIRRLLALLDRLRERRVVHDVANEAIGLFTELVHAECRKHRLSDYWGQNLQLLSLRMTESASKTGERYITSSPREYFGMLGSAALGGLIIALMAALKLALGAQGMAPLNHALSFCLNYAIGFALIHILGGTVATKQPAMTANAIAASIGGTRSKPGDLDALADLIVRTIRSQIAAILGNIGVAIPVAILIGLLIVNTSGTQFISPARAQALLDEVDPRGGALFFAGVAGLCLFLSGLIAAYFDNFSAYNRIPERLRQLRWPRRVLGEARAARVIAYIENNLGALAGNVFFGFLLGGASALGVLFGLPLDIRHIAFSAAFLGYAGTALDFAVPAQAVALALAGVLLIGAVNLVVSFTLTLAVAMRARRIGFARGRVLGRMLVQRVSRRPQDFLLPPFGATAASTPPAPAASRFPPRRPNRGSAHPSSAEKTLLERRALLGRPASNS